MGKVFLLVAVFVVFSGVSTRIVDKFRCPEVRAEQHFDLEQFASNVSFSRRPTLKACVSGLYADATRASKCKDESSKTDILGELTVVINMLGNWFVVEYYASAEEALSYSCMKSVFAQDDHVRTANGSVEWTPGVTMNFTYRFADDPLGENLFGNITWRIDLNQPAHWTHAESTYDGIYNTYVLDTEYRTWALLLHCAEQREGARYLSAFVLSRNTTLPKNVMAYLRDKLPRYDIDMNYVFPIPHENCSSRPARFNYSPILVEVDSRVPQTPGVTYDVGNETSVTLRG